MTASAWAVRQAPGKCEEAAPRSLGSGAGRLRGSRRRGRPAHSSRSRVLRTPPVAEQADADVVVLFLLEVAADRRGRGPHREAGPVRHARRPQSLPRVEQHERLHQQPVIGQAALPETARPMTSAISGTPGTGEPTERLRIRPKGSCHAAAIPARAQHRGVRRRRTRLDPRPGHRPARPRRPLRRHPGGRRGGRGQPRDTRRTQVSECGFHGNRLTGPGVSPGDCAACGAAVPARRTGGR
jgi:hypothetical protein